MSGEGTSPLHSRPALRRVESADDDASYIYEVIEDDDDEEEEPSRFSPKSSGSRRFLKSVTSPETKVRVLYKNRQGSSDIKSDDETEYITEEYEEEEVLEDTDDSDYDDEAEVIEVFEEEEVLEDVAEEDEESSTEVVANRYGEDMDDSDRKTVKLSNSNVFSASTSRMMQAEYDCVDSDGDDQHDEGEETINDEDTIHDDDTINDEETLADDDLDALEEYKIVEAARMEAPPEPEEDDDDEDDGVTKDELAEAIEYILRQEKAVANFILTESQAEVMMSLPKKIMKLIVDHLEICDNSGAPIDWDFMLMIVLPFCDKPQMGDDDDDEKSRQGLQVGTKGLEICMPVGEQTDPRRYTSRSGIVTGDEVEGDDEGSSEDSYGSEFHLKGVKDDDCDSSISNTSKHRDDDEGSSGSSDDEDE